MMLGQRNAIKKRCPRRPLIESLECRQLLSVSAADVTVVRNDVYLRTATAASSSSIQGYTPAQITTAYDFNKISFGSGNTADGQGQTIAIIDAYNDPRIAADLSVFDTQFGLSAPPSLKVVNQAGGSTLPTTDPGWAGEISLDVEWAHAVAPGANILLVEATSDSLANLMSAVDYARNAAGVSVVSMSWGGSEFFSFNGAEFTGQTQYDPYFTTPQGHQGVTFVAAAGDSGASGGVEWPASSPNVLSVGGTSLYVQDDSGSYYTESSWSGTSGGFSEVEVEPSYQDSVQSTGVRTTPDVAYDADPNTGFAVYDSLAYEGYSGWQVIGGTSAGAPQWAALIAIANQGRSLSGHATLDGVSQTLPLLYSLYADPSSSDYSTYTSYFNDVIDSVGGSGRYHWRFGGYGYSNPATAGYDLATGLGTPIANMIVQALAGSDSSTTPGGGMSTGGTTGTTSTTPAQLPASTLDGVFINPRTAPIVGGQNGMLKLRLTNTGNSRFTGPVSVTLYVSTNSSTDSASLTKDTFVKTITFPNLKIGVDGSQLVGLNFTYPSTVSSDSYYIIASIQELGMTSAPAVTATPLPISITAPFVDLAATFAASQHVLVNPGHLTSVVLTIKNVGNFVAVGSVSLSLYASTSQTLDTSAATLLANPPSRQIRILPGHSIKIRLSFWAPSALTAGDYYLIASTSSSTTLSDGNSTNDVAVIATRS
jgi:subtilase family serine protease